MTKPVIVTRLGKGSELTFAEGDANFTNLRDATISVSGDSGSTQNIDLNGTIAVAGGTGLSTAMTSGTVTVNLDNTAVTAGSYTKASITVDAQGRITSASNGSADFTTSDARSAISITDMGGDGSLTYDSQTGKFEYTGPSATDVRAHFSASTGITITNGAIATTITQYTNSDARSAISATQNLTYDSQTGVITGPNLTGYEQTSNKNAANGYAGLDSNGKVASAQLPSYVDDVEEYADKPGFPVTGETGKIYVAQDNGKIYRWSGSAYVEISPSPGSTDSVTEGSTNLYFTTQRARDAFSASTGITITNGAIATSITQYADSNARAAISVTDSGGDGSLSYDNQTGVITYTGPSATDVRAHFSASTGITITNGAIATTITQYADSNARAAISVTDSGGDGSLSYDNQTGVITYSGPGTTEYRAAFSAGTGITITSGVIASTVTGGITDVVQDTTPQLGGNLDVNGQSIVSVSNGNIVLAPNGTGKSKVNNINYYETPYTLTYGATITPDVANGNVQVVTLTGNVTFSAFTNPVSGQSLTLIVKQDATGSRTLTSTMKFSGGTKTLTTAANSVDIITVFYDGTTYWASLGKDFK